MPIQLKLPALIFTYYLLHIYIYSVMDSCNSIDVKIC